MPDTPLTDILSDFRSYRPGNHRQFLEWVQRRAHAIGVRDFAMKEADSAGTFKLLVRSIGLDHAIVLYLLALNQVRDFRWRHWCFTREYILKKTCHPTATGGSPIVLVSFSVDTAAHIDIFVPVASQPTLQRTRPDSRSWKAL